MEYSIIGTPESDLLLYVVDDFSHDFPTAASPSVERTWRSAPRIMFIAASCAGDCPSSCASLREYVRQIRIVAPLYRLTGVAGHAIFLPSSSARARARNSPIQFRAASRVRETMAPISGRRRDFLSSKTYILAIS